MSIVHDAESALGTVDRLLRLAVLRQFIKFCLVGATSTAIHLGTYYYLLHLGEPAWVRGVALPRWFSSGDLYMLVAYSAGFTLAVTNGFFWNRLWTFRGAHRRGTRTQYVLFFLVNVVGLVLSNAIVFTLVNVLEHWGCSEAVARRITPLLALPAVAIWNFTANRYWTFAAPAPGE